MFFTSLRLEVIHAARVCVCNENGRAEEGRRLLHRARRHRANARPFVSRSLQSDHHARLLEGVARVATALYLSLTHSLTLPLSLSLSLSF